MRLFGALWIRDTKTVSIAGKTLTRESPNAIAKSARWNRSCADGWPFAA